MNGKNSNYVEKDDGYYKSGKSSTKGGQHQLDRPAPPVRDSANRPLIPNSGGRIDVARWIQEVNSENHDQ